MPIYEYDCIKCDNHFDALRPMSKADAIIRCDQCNSDKTKRAISVFSAQSNGKNVAGSNTGCSSCSSASCSSCTN